VCRLGQTSRCISAARGLLLLLKQLSTGTASTEQVSAQTLEAAACLLARGLTTKRCYIRSP
jgi:hypothetical protein